MLLPPAVRAATRAVGGLLTLSVRRCAFGLAASAPQALDYDHRFLHMSWGDEAKTYPLVWLRNNCQCPRCFHASSLGRRILGRDMPVEPQLASVRAVPEAGRLLVSWEDGHESVYEYEWLIERAFNGRQREQRAAEVLGLDLRQAWGHRFSPARLDFASTMASEAGILQMLTELKRHGLCLLQDAEGDNAPLHEMSRRLGYALPTIYGNYFEVQAKAEPSNLAFTTDELGLHTDLVYYQSPPGIQMLHCVRQSPDIEGGVSCYADGLLAARRLRESDRKAFDLLATESILFWDDGSDFVKDFSFRCLKPTLELDEAGEMTAIRYNHQMRDSHMTTAPEKVPDLYRALALLERLLMEEAVFLKLREGEIVCFDNTRVLHGRTAYRMKSPSAERHLRGVFYSWDVANSHFRRLREKRRQ